MWINKKDERCPEADLALLLAGAGLKEGEKGAPGVVQKQISNTFNYTSSLTSD